MYCLSLELSSPLQGMLLFKIDGIRYILVMLITRYFYCVKKVYLLLC